MCGDVILLEDQPMTVTIAARPRRLRRGSALPELEEDGTTCTFDPFIQGIYGNRKELMEIDEA
jgi:hypothetical protein